MADLNNTSELAWLQFKKKKAECGEISERDEAALFAQCVELQVLKAIHSVAPPLFVFAQCVELQVLKAHRRYRRCDHVVCTMR